MLFTPTTELFIDGAWVNITSDTFMSEGVSITRGRADEASTADTSTCSLSLNNRIGNYAPRNPNGVYYGKIGRNTPLRVRMPSTLQNYMAVPGVQVSPGGFPHISTRAYATTPHHASLAITGNIDIRIDVEPETWRPPVDQWGEGGYGLAQKVLVGTDTSRSWAFWVNEGGYLAFRWSPDGSITAPVLSTVAVPASSGRLAVRVERVLSTGVVTFYTAPTLGGSYTQLGGTVATAAGVALNAGNADLDVGYAEGEGIIGGGLQGKVYGFALRTGSGGSIVAQPDFTAQDSGTTAFTDASSRPWSLVGGALMANPAVRFHGEVSALPTRWDKTGRDIRTALQAYGVLRRLGQPTAPLRSVMYRWLTSADSPGVVAYWPCEDGDDADEFASALPGASPMEHPAGATNNSSYDQFKASAPLPTASLVQWTGSVPTYTVTGNTQVRFLLAVPSGGVPATADVCRIRAADLAGAGLNAARWDLTLGVGGSLRMQIFNNEAVSVQDSGFVAAGLNGKRVLVSIEIDDNGPDISWIVNLYEVGQPGGLFSFSDFMSNRSFGRIARLAMNVRGIMDDVALGHISVQTQFTNFLSADEDRLVAYKGEIAAARMMRLCREESIPVMIKGVSSSGALLGPQLPGNFLDLLQEIADADMGIMYEPREFLGLAYRTRGSLYAQEATLTLDYEDDTVSEIEPTEDDQATRNDITVTRINGGSARVEDTTSALSVLPPPDGVGRYEDGVSISLSRDVELLDQASWRLHLGTVDEERYPTIGFTLASGGFTSDAARTAAAAVLDVGDRILITNRPTGVGAPEDIQQLAQGFDESFTGPEWIISTNCSPASPWDVAVWDDTTGPGEARYSSDGTTLLATSALLLNGTSPGRASTPDTGVLDILGDIDIRVHAALTDWTPASTQTLVSKSTASGNQRSWQLNVNSTGNLVLVTSADGTATLTQASSAVLPVTNGAPLWVRATLDVDNGAAQRVYTFYTSVDGVTWTQLGSTFAVGGVTTIFNSSAAVVVGSVDVGATNRLIGRVFALEVRNGIGGTVVANPVFGSQAAGATSFVDSAGRTWTISSPAVISGAAILVNTPTGPVWGAADAPYDWMIGGERVTVTALAGTGAQQLATVTRSVNGVVKTHAVGVDVGLFKPAIYAL